MTYTFYSHFPLNDLFQLFEKQSLQGDVLTHSKSLSGVVNVLPFGTEMTLSLKGIPLALKW